MGYAELKIMEAMPDFLHGRNGDEEVFRRLAGAKIVQIGSAAEGDTFRAFQREHRTFPVLHFPGVPFEIPFRKVARKMGFAD